MRAFLSGYEVHANDLQQTNTAALFYHRLIEAFKFAYAKRSELGDPAKVNITDVRHFIDRSCRDFEFSSLSAHSKSHLKRLC